MARRPWPALRMRHLDHRSLHSPKDLVCCSTVGDTNWGKLYQAFGDAVADRVRLSEEQREREAAIAEFDNWCARAVESVMQQCHVDAQNRAREFFEHTGHQIAVRYPDAPPIVTDDTISVLCLTIELGQAVVHVYSSRTSGRMPYIHITYASGSKTRRLLCIAGCALVRTGPEDFALREIVRGEPQRVINADDLVFRAFELLVTLVNLEQLASVSRPPRSAM